MTETSLLVGGKVWSLTSTEGDKLTVVLKLARESPTMKLRELRSFLVLWVGIFMQRTTHSIIAHPHCASEGAEV